MLNNALEHDLYPRRYTRNNTDIPLRCILYHFIQLRIPVALACNAVARFVKMLEPEWNIPGGNATQVARIICAVVIEVRTAADHEHSFCKESFRKIIMMQGHDLAYARFADST